MSALTTDLPPNDSQFPIGREPFDDALLRNQYERGGFAQLPLGQSPLTSLQIELLRNFAREAPYGEPMESYGFTHGRLRLHLSPAAAMYGDSCDSDLAQATFAKRELLDWIGRITGCSSLSLLGMSLRTYADNDQIGTHTDDEVAVVIPMRTGDPELDQYRGGELTINRETPDEQRDQIFVIRPGIPHGVSRVIGPGARRAFSIGVH
ncbi:MAG: hypothetical protein KDD70_10205 [Bdellovibrionales bacterium]|nr:hypothetical protein [Bdellovibrionales bacterium]